MIRPIFIFFCIHQIFGSSLEAAGSSSSSAGIVSSRSLENYLSRLNSRLDTIVVRIDHLDNKIGRVQTLLSTRLDGIENSVATMKLRLDLVKEEVSRVDENLNRKWKNFETKMETSLIAADNRYESKLNMVLREGRRIGESLHGIFSGVEKRVTVLLSQVNTSLIEFTELNNSSLKAAAAGAASSGGGFSNSGSGSVSSGLTSSHGVFTSSSASSGSSSTIPTTPQPPPSNLIINKVSNMFDDLIERSARMEGMLRESITLANVTRSELHDSFHTLSLTNRMMRPSTGSHSGGIRGTSVAEETSMAILETLASTESMSTTISRRLNELTRTIEERFEWVSLTLNEFYESCSRIQERAPLVEEHIAELLEKILNSFENSTSILDYKQLEKKLDAIELKCVLQPELLRASSTATPSSSSSTRPASPPSSTTVSSTSESAGNAALSGTGGGGNAGGNSSDSGAVVRSSYEQLIHTSEELSEEDKKLLWDSLFPHFNGSSVPE